MHFLHAPRSCWAWQYASERRRLTRKGGCDAMTIEPPAVWLVWSSEQTCDAVSVLAIAGWLANRRGGKAGTSTVEAAWCLRVTVIRDRISSPQRQREGGGAAERASFGFPLTLFSCDQSFFLAHKLWQSPRLDAALPSYSLLASIRFLASSQPLLLATASRHPHLRDDLSTDAAA